MRKINLAAASAGTGLLRPVNRAQSRPSAREWYRITAGKDGTATVSIYDEVGYWGVTASDFCAQLRDLDAEKIDVRINTPGGDVYDGVAIYNALIDHPADVTTIVDGMAASIGSVIAQAGDLRIMSRATEMMIHLPLTGCAGNANDMRKAAALLDQIGESLAAVYTDRAGGATEMWLKAMEAETWYSAEEAVTAGLADAVQGKAAPDATAHWDRSVYNYAGREAAPPPPRFEKWNPAAIRDMLREAVTK